MKGQPPSDILSGYREKMHEATAEKKRAEHATYMRGWRAARRAKFRDGRLTRFGIKRRFTRSDKRETPQNIFREHANEPIDRARN